MLSLNKSTSVLKKLIIYLSLILIFMGSVYSEEYYWENPKSISENDAIFPVAISNENYSYLFWQEVDKKENKIYLTFRRYDSVDSHFDNIRFAGPFTYSGDEIPDIYTVATLPNGTIAVAVLSNISEISIYTSTDRGEHFTHKKLRTSGMMVAPRIYATNNNEFKLFTSLGEEEAFAIYTAESSDGQKWSSFKQFEPTIPFRNPFIPVLGTINGKNVVVFQAQYTDPNTGRLSYQLYMTVETEGIWSVPILITGQDSLNIRDDTPFYKYQNQRPFLYNFEGKLYMSWERMSSITTDIWVCELTEQGINTSNNTQVTKNTNASRGILFSYKGSLYCNWFDTRSGREAIYMAQKDGNYWEETTLVDNKNANLFTYPFIINDNGENLLNFVFEQKTSNNKNTIAILSPDTSVLPPTIKAVSYKEGRSSRSGEVKYEIKFPQDSSGIAIYEYTWTKIGDFRPLDRGKDFTNHYRLTLEAPDDGEYLLTVRVRDYADNWSETTSIKYQRDLTPPIPPVIVFDNLDEYGFVESNNYNIHWEPSASEDTAGYSYRIDRIGGIPKKLAISSRHPYTLEDEEIISLRDDLLNRYSNELDKKRRMSGNVQTTNTFTPRYYNRSNGVYIISVSAIDQVGNVSDPSKMLYILNKYEPSTYITAVEQERTNYGDTILTISGGGFTYDGIIDEIYIDKDGVGPYDFILKVDEDFEIKNNTKIVDINVGNSIGEGSYKVGVHHTDRGNHFTGTILDIAQNGTVKIEAEYVPQYYLNSEFARYAYIIANNTLLLVLFILLTALVAIFIFVAIIFTLQENRSNNTDIKKIIKGERRYMAEKDKIKGKHLPSLKGKLIRFTFALIIVIVTVVTIQNGRKSIEAQTKTMASGLLNRAEVLLDSLSSGVRNFLPGKKTNDLTALPKQMQAMEEVQYVTILGLHSDFVDENTRKEAIEKGFIVDDRTNKEVFPTNLDYIWATNDNFINNKIDESEIRYGKTLIKDEQLLGITHKFIDLNKIIVEEQKELSDDIKKHEDQALYEYSKNTEEGEKEGEKLSKKSQQLRNKLDDNLMVYSKENLGSIPYFDVNNLDMNNTEYLFYKPVIYRDAKLGTYVQAVVVLELSTESLIDNVTKEMTRILTLGLIIAAVAVLAGIVGSYLFASLIVRPIKKLEAHVTMIGETKNKINLKGKDVKIKSKDEVGRLGDAINVMTRELVTNAEEEELAMDGKAVQKAFLPLADTGVNTKNTIAEYEDKNLQIYGYYEGEAGVSGDYFDYKKLDDKWYSIIKCDASGHGIPAAIIMTVVATIFRRYFEKWSFAKNGVRLNTLVEQINDFIEGLGLKGKFATLIICLLNVKTGELYMCNAGDNLVHIFDGKTKKMKVITLSSAPTAGVFPSDLVNLRGGFVVEKTVLNKGDTLFLYTDGIEESTRRIRESDYSVRQNEVEFKRFNPKTKEEEVLTQLEDSKEEFGPERVAEIIESVYNKQKYVLKKLDNPTPETLEFDFEKCEGTVKEAILALASLEKVYRLYKPDNIQQTDYIKIDKKIDEFLSRYFNRYSYYAANKSEVGENSNYLDYDEMLEDEQSDDLTLLAIKRI